MIPGGRGMDPRRVKKMMDQLGVKVEEIERVEEVKIICYDKIYDFSNPTVTAMNAQGKITFQVAGKYQTSNRMPQEDVELVAAQAQVSEEEARRALKQCGNNPADAIIWLMDGK